MAPLLRSRCAAACLALLCLAALPHLGASFVDPASCGGGDCCWSDSTEGAERYCACTAAAQLLPVEANPCALVRCARGPPEGACAGAAAAATTPTVPLAARGGAFGRAARPAVGAACACPKMFRPVCVNGTQYPNACVVRRAALRTPLPDAQNLSSRVAARSISGALRRAHRVGGGAVPPGARAGARARAHARVSAAARACLGLRGATLRRPPPLFR
jgi:hypothetical protein